MSEDLVIVTNDDGVDADGIQALYEAACCLGRPIVVAPSSCYSQCSHSVTTAKELEVTEVRPDWYSISGTPSDCVRLAVGHLVPHAKWVLSGINHGANLGGDVWVSGTVAAAREAALRGVRAIALSQYRRPDVKLCWQTSARRARTVIEQIVQREIAVGSFWNVNLPARDPDTDVFVRECRVDQLPLPVTYYREQNAFRYVSSYHERPRTPGLDVDLCFSGNATMSLLKAYIMDG